MSRALILVVEDLAEDVVQGPLEAAGYRVLVACSGEEAAEQAEACPPAAVVVDMLMVDIDGLSVCRFLRQCPQTANVPIVAVTALADSQMQAAALDAGADVCLARPLDWAELHEQVRSLGRHVRYDGGGMMPALGDLPRDEAEGIIRLLEHDLKSPSSDIVSGMELLVESPETSRTPVGERVLYSGLVAARRQLRLIDEMLSLIRLESGALPLDVEAVDMAGLLGEVLAETGKALERKGIRVTNQIPAGLPPIAAVPALLRLVLISLIDNSVKFCVRDATLTIDALVDHGCLILTLTDTGRPVAPEYTDTIFDLAVQWRARRDGSRTSVAWGLPFCRAALQAMHGNIRVRSVDAERGTRTTFAIELPVYA